MLFVAEGVGPVGAKGRDQHREGRWNGEPARFKSGDQRKGCHEFAKHREREAHLGSEAGKIIKFDLAPGEQLEQLGVSVGQHEGGGADAQKGEAEVVKKFAVHARNVVQIRAEHCFWISFKSKIPLP